MAQSQTEQLYAPLKQSQIRLLHLAPSTTPSTPLHGTLSSTTLSSPSQYTALSYTWGSSYLTHSILLPHLPLSITPNLDAALRHLRQPRTTRVLWIDQICINQRNTLERNTQVALMAQIYSRATLVVAWIGSLDDSTKIALTYLPTLLQKVRAFAPNSRLPPVDPAKSLGLMVVGSPAWQNLSRVFARPYFRRVWIVQEVVRARRDGVVVKCGEWSGAWEDLALASRQFEFNHQYSENAHDAVALINGLRLRLLEGGAGGDLVDLLFAAYALKCGDPRDKVFGLLGLADEVGLVADYGSDAEAVYRATARYLIVERGRLDVLCCVIHPKILSLPSWAPDWSCSIGVRQRISGDSTETSTTSAQFRHSFSPAGDILSVFTVAVGEIKVTTDPMPPIKYTGVLPEWENLARSAAHPKGLTYPEIYWRALLATDEDTAVSERAKQGNRCYNAWQNVTDTRYLGRRDVQDFFSAGVMSLDELNQRSGVFQNLMEMKSIGRKLMLSVDKHLILGPDAAMPGDVVCLIYGCPAHILVRFTGTDTGVVVGECYAQGFMDRLNEEPGGGSKRLHLH